MNAARPSIRLVGRLVGNFAALVVATRRTRLLVVATCLCGCVLGAFDVAFAAAMVPFLGNILAGGSVPPDVFRWLYDMFGLADMTAQQTAFIGMLGLFSGLVVRQTLVGLTQTLEVVMAIRVSQELRVLLVDSIVHARMRYIDRMEFGEIKQLLASEIVNVSAFMRGAPGIFSSLVTLLLAAVLLVILSPTLFLLAVLIAAVFVPAKLRLTRLIHRYASSTVDAGVGFMGTMDQLLGGAKQVKILNRQIELITRLAGLSITMERARRTYSVVNLWEPVLMQIAALLSIAALFWGAQVTGIATLTEAVGFCLLLYRVAPSAVQSSNRTSQLIVREPSVQRVLDLLRQLRGEREKDEGRHALTRPIREIRFEGVSFSYAPERAVLQDLNWSARRGDYIAFVGASGSGKTSLVQLLLKLYTPSSGSIVVDGRPLSDFTNQSIRTSIGLMTQDVFLFNDSVADVIRGGLSSLPDEAVRQAAREAQADSFIQAMPNGYASPVGERGALLSGGQRQRLMLANLLARKADIIILDEATSALDTVTEKGVLDAFEEIRKDRILIVVTHRVENLRNATMIHVLDAGRIVERGTWDELTVRDGAFTSLLRRGESEHAGEATQAVYS